MSKKISRDDQINEIFGDFLAWLEENGRPKFAASTLESKLFDAEYQRWQRETMNARVVEGYLRQASADDLERMAKDKRGEDDKKDNP